MANAHVGGTRSTITFVYMYTGAKHMLKLANASEDGQLYSLVASLVFCAFTLEAYLNHLGSLVNSEWNKIERNLPKFKKYALLAERADVLYNLNDYPHRTLKELFDFRDCMAHGKTTEESVSLYLDIDDNILPQIYADTDWQAFATIENVERSIRNLEIIIKELHSHSGYSGNPFSRFGSAMYGVSPHVS